MNIAGIEYNLNHRALEIYIAGCNGPYCAGCHNQELWDFNVGYSLYDWEFTLHMADTKQRMFDSVWILGGEPQDQDIDDLNFLLRLWKKRGKTVVLFTRYTELKPEVDRDALDYVKYGPYDMYGDSYVEPVLGITLASTNQYIAKVNKWK